jgi:hypothetical protein
MVWISSRLVEKAAAMSRVQGRRLADHIAPMPSAMIYARSKPSRAFPERFITSRYEEELERGPMG